LAARKSAARLLGAEAGEIALLGPTSLGINLVAKGLTWQPGDEVLYYSEDYPANVYPWSDLERLGVKPIALQPDWPGALTWDVVEAALTERTRLVALATCHFLSGFRVRVEHIGEKLHERGILFSVDGIQTLGAFPLNVEHIDFLSADSHKWLLGPLGAGIFYVKKERQDELRPVLLGSWNVVSPGFIAQDEIRFHTSGQRYEPGALNLPGIVGMTASMDLLLDIGIEGIGARLLELRAYLLEHLRPLGFQLYLEELDQSPAMSDDHRSGIVSVQHPERDVSVLFEKLKGENVTVSLRQNREGTKFLRFSPHFYNTTDELARAIDLLSD